MSLKLGTTEIPGIRIGIGEAVTAQEKTVLPSSSQFVVLPDTGYNYLSQVIVQAIPYAETLNAAGGYTVTIG